MNKLLVVSAVAVLGLSSVAFAGKHHNHHHVNKAPCPCVKQASVVTCAASDAGWFIGLQSGLGLTNWKNAENSYVGGSDHNDDVHADNAFVGRIFTGYDFNKYFALEGGYSYFFNEAKFTPHGLYNIKTTAFDIYGKGTLPLVDKFDLYAKLGLDLLMTNINNAPNRQNVGIAFGAGVDYHFTPNVITNAEWSRMNGNARISSDRYQPNTDAFMVGVRYKFDA